MQRISKNNRKATEYKKWEASLGKNPHPEYKSTYRFYKDVLFDLILCQGGLCAYTEYRLINKSEIPKIKSKFLKGRFKGDFKDLPIDIEHFDSRLKTKYGWRWSNLFAVYDLINQKVKRREEAKLISKGKSVYSIMKPDSSSYDPKSILQYERNTDLFIPNTKKLDPKEIQQVKEMILCLGLNNGFIKMKRSEYYKELDCKINIGDKVNPQQFITGWKMR
jgi:hypothetical protein